MWKVRVRNEEAKEPGPTGSERAPSHDHGLPERTGEAADSAPMGPERIEIKPVFDEANQRYRFTVQAPLRQIIPCFEVGALYWNGQHQTTPFRVSEGDLIEYLPAVQSGLRIWEFDVSKQGLYVIAKVTHEKPGRYRLPQSISCDTELRLEDVTIWEETQPEGEYWDEAHLTQDLQSLGIVHGINPRAWDSIQAVEGKGNVTIATATMAVEPQPAQIEDFVGGSMQGYDEGKDRIDFFGSKVKFVREGDVLARKIPGIEGIPGINVFGQPIPPKPMKDLRFKLKKNVHLSEDGLEVIASCAGLPVRIDQTTYLVENVYLQNRDVDLESGSIEFPGDVIILGNVQDGLHVYSQGKVEIQGSVSKAEIRAEKGLIIHHNVLGGRLVIGERFVVRSELLRQLRELHEELTHCLTQAAELANCENAKHLKPGQCLKILLERKFVELPKIAANAEKYILNTKDPLVTENLTAFVRTVKRFLTGLGPLEPQALPLLERINQALGDIVVNISIEVPEKLECSIDYIQGATVECGGSLECHKGAYNSIIKTEGDLKISGVCRGGKIISGGNVEIRELGGSGVSVTSVQISGTKRLKVGYCHPNVMIIVDKEIIRIEDAYKELEVYRERGLVQVDRLPVHPQ